MASLLARLNQVGISKAAFKQDGISLQQTLAPMLRQKAVDHLANAQGTVAQSFRGEYLASGQGDYKRFLRTQSQPGIWATYIEAAALGEMLGCHVVVTPVKQGIEQATICLYRAADDHAPTVHLYNSNNTHWYANSSTPTSGDGNCLYNAFAQELKAKVAPELRFNDLPSTRSHGFLNQKPVVNDAQAIAFQKKIEAMIRRHPAPAQTDAALLSEKERISHLSVEEQQQIFDDHRLALALSREEMGYVRKNVYSSPYEQRESESNIRPGM
jgi:hypothetical protein